MTRLSRVLLAAIVAITIGACGSESQFPVATGKGTIRMINAVPTSPDIVFRIEERRIDTVAYRNNSAPQQWDDLEYTFNFEYTRLLAVDPTRVASQLLDVVRDTEYTLVLRGSLEAPTVNIWEIAERSFTDADTVFEMRLGHAADVLGPIDVYIGPEGVAPAPGAQVATLAPGEVSVPSDVEAGTYIITVTTAGDAGDILFESVPAQIVAGQSLLMTILEGVGADTAPVIARIFNQQGVSSTLTDARFPPTARFIHATTDLGTSDIYDDEALQNRIVADLAFGDITGDIDVALGDIPITATAPGNVGAIQFEGTLATVVGGRVNYYLSELAGEIVGTPVRFDRRPIETFAQLTFFHSSTNHRLVDLYVVDADATIDDTLPRAAGLVYLQQIPPIALNEGSRDIYITTSGEKTVVEGPIRLEAAFGDVYEAVLLDRVDPSLAELKFFPAP